MKILSIDWDYFMDVDSNFKQLYFPDCHTEEVMAYAPQIWQSRYLQHGKTLLEVGTKNLQVIKDYIAKHKFKQAYYNISHKDLYSLLDDDSFIVNVDDHSDYFDFNGEVHCGNWLRAANENGLVEKAIWVKNETSYIQDDFPFGTTTDLSIINDYKFDMIFFCLSPIWSPPHLNDQFTDLIKGVRL